VARVCPSLIAVSTWLFHAQIGHHDTCGGPTTISSLAEPHRTLIRDHDFGGLSVPAGVKEPEHLHRALALGSWMRFVPVLLASSIVMNKSLAIIAGLILAAAFLLWSTGDNGGGVGRASVVVNAPSATELEPLGVDLAEHDGPPAGVRMPAHGARAADEDASATRLDWIVRGRVVFSDGATGDLPIVQVRLAAYDGYTATGEPFASALVTSTASGTIAWPLADPERTVSIRAELLDIAGFSARVQSDHLAVAGEGPVESIRVRVNPRDAWVEGKVIASHEAANPDAPIEGAHVVYNEAHTTTDANGAYRMAVPSRGYGSVIVTAAGFHKGGATPGGLSAGTTTQVDVILDPEFGPEGTVFGYVRNGRGAVLPNATVHCGSARIERVQTDATGYYELHGIRLHLDGSVVVTASHDGMAAQEKRVRAATDGTPPVAGTQLDFELTVGARIEGTVVDSEGTPVRGAEVWIGPHSGFVANRRTHSDDDGAFAFENAAPGWTLLGARKAGQPGHIQELTVPESSATLLVEIALERAVPLRGRVLDTEGEPIEGVQIVAQRGTYGRSVRQSARSAADGSFEITGVALGEFGLTVSRNGLVRQTISHVHDGSDLELVVEHAVRLTGRVIDAATGDPIEAFAVRLAPTEDPSLGAWFNGIDISWVMGGRQFNSIDGRWSTDDKDPIRSGAWTFVEVEAEGYEVLRLGPLEVGAGGGTGGDGDECVHRLVAR